MGAFFPFYFNALLNMYIDISTIKLLLLLLSLSVIFHFKGQKYGIPLMTQ